MHLSLTMLPKNEIVNLNQTVFLAIWAVPTLTLQFTKFVQSQPENVNLGRKFFQAIGRITKNRTAIPIFAVYFTKSYESVLCWQLLQWLSGPGSLPRLNTPRSGVEVRGATVRAAIPPWADGECAPTGGSAAGEAIPLAGSGVPALQASEGRTFVWPMLVRRLVPVQGRIIIFPQQDAGVPERRDQPKIPAPARLRGMDSWSQMMRAASSGN